MGWYCSGSGIFQRGRSLTSFYNPTSTPMSVYLDPNTILSNGPTIRSLDDKKDLKSISFHRSQFHDLSANHSNNDSNATLHRFYPNFVGEPFAFVVESPLGLRCNVSGVVTNLAQPPVSLAVVAIRGLVPELGFPQWGIEYCGVVACPSDTCLNSLVLTSNVTIASVHIHANFQVDKYRLFPILLQSNAMVVDDLNEACNVIDLTSHGSMQCYTNWKYQENSDNNINNDTSTGTLSVSLLGMEIQ